MVSIKYSQMNVFKNESLRNSKCNNLKFWQIFKYKKWLTSFKSTPTNGFIPNLSIKSNF